jgi:hypothetical protein
MAVAESQRKKTSDEIEEEYTPDDEEIEMGTSDDEGLDDGEEECQGATLKDDAAADKEGWSIIVTCP